METAAEFKHSFPNAEIIIEPLLSEYQPYMRHNITLYPAGIPTTHRGTETSFTFPETYDKHIERVHFIINKILEKHNADEDILIITHGEVLKTFCEYLNSIHPDLLLNIGTAPYLSIISFETDQNKEIIETSITKE